MMSVLKNSFHFERPRLNSLLMNGVKHPFVTIYAGAGYGKTSAIHDFTEKYDAPVAWFQLSERDNVGARFWENYVHSMSLISKPFAQNIAKLGFPDNDDKLNKFSHFARGYIEDDRHILVFDDFHLIEAPAVLHFLERGARDMLPGTSVFVVSRATPKLNISSLVPSGGVYNINEDDLRFTEQELAEYFRNQEISLRPGELRTIMQDTGGWAFAINLVARSYRKAPGYEGYIKRAMKTNVFQLMESEIWRKTSERLKCFLVQLSLIGHLSIDLIGLLADKDKDLIAEMEKQSAYVRRDEYINAYLIHNLFLEFLSEKQDLLTEEQKNQTYRIAADWCDRNGFKIDALAYFEKVRDYESIVRIFFELPTQVPQDIARYAIGIFERAPEEAFDSVDIFAVMHVRTVLCLGHVEEALTLMRYYEKKYSVLPEDDDFRNHVLGGIYYCWGIAQSLLCTVNDIYDFDQYYAKMDECLSRSPVDPGQISNHPSGPWVSLVGSTREGAPREFIESFERSVSHVSRCFNGAMTGLDDLARGELKFYQGDVRSAETHIIQGLEKARVQRQFETVHRAFFYLLKIALFQGNLVKAEQTLSDMDSLLSENDYTDRFIEYDIALSWYYTFLDMPDRVPDWVKEKFSPYGHAYFIENFGNQAKARYCYRSANYPLLLGYIEEQKKRESMLFGRLEMLAMEACVHYKMKDRSRAFAVLREAWRSAAPNNIILPFIELGKDMRTLISAVAREGGCGIPGDWLEEAGHKAASYAKRQSHIISEYKRVNHLDGNITFSQRETEVLTDLSHGLSRKEIAVNRGISINTVKMMIGHIYNKLQAENLPDLIRIATERKII